MAPRDRIGQATHAILRIGAGLLFFQHGAPKLFGWFGGFGPEGGRAELVSLMGLAGILEVFGGLLIVLGFLTRPVAVVLALLYLSVWIFLVGNGAGPFSVDRMLRGRGNRPA